MTDLTLYHNPRCSKSRGALELLEARGLQPQVVRYLEAPPSASELKSLLGKLGRETFLLDLVPGSIVPALPEFNGRMQDENTLEVELEKSQSLNSLFEQLSAQGVKVLSMRNKANRLEELFVNLVEEGRKA